MRSTLIQKNVPENLLWDPVLVEVVDWMGAGQGLLALAPHVVRPGLLGRLLVDVEYARDVELDAVEVRAHQRPDLKHAGGTSLSNLDHLPGRIHECPLRALQESADGDGTRAHHTAARVIASGSLIALFLCAALLGLELPLFLLELDPVLQSI